MIVELNMIAFNGEIDININRRLVRSKRRWWSKGYRLRKLNYSEMKVFFASFAIFFGFLGVSQAFLNYGVYTIRNKGLDKQLLTFVNRIGRNNASLPVVPPEMHFAGTDVGGQKWRLDKSALYTAFELRPTLNEDYVLEYIPESGILRWLSGFGNTKLWYLLDAGDAYTMIKHKRSEVCLQAHENNATITAQKCDGSVFQQWKFETNNE